MGTLLWRLLYMIVSDFKRCRNVVETETAHFKGAKYNGIYSSCFRVEKVFDMCTVVLCSTDAAVEYFVCGVFCFVCVVVVCSVSLICLLFRGVFCFVCVVV